MSRVRLVALAFALASTSCGLFGGDSGETDGSAASTATDTGGPTTGEPIYCVFAEDCPLPGPCESVACVESACAYDLQPADHVADDLAGDCRSLVCDGAGGWTPQVDDADLPDDGNDCTDDLCAGGEPSNLGRAVGSLCEGDRYCHPDLTCQPCPVRDKCGDDSAAEPNETQSAAASLAQVHDDADARYLCETLGSPEDVDWFVYETLDTALGAVAPVADMMPADARVCMYFQCMQGGTSVVCPDEAADANAPLGQRGCCGHGRFEPYVDCKGFKEDATVWLRVEHDAEDPPLCLNYQLGYVF